MVFFSAGCTLTGGPSDSSLLDGSTSTAVVSSTSTVATSPDPGDRDTSSTQGSPVVIEPVGANAIWPLDSLRAAAGSFVLDDCSALPVRLVAPPTGHCPEVGSKDAGTWCYLVAGVVDGVVVASSVAVSSEYVLTQVHPDEMPSEAFDNVVVMTSPGIDSVEGGVVTFSTGLQVGMGEIRVSTCGNGILDRDGSPPGEQDSIELLIDIDSLEVVGARCQASA